MPDEEIAARFELLGEALDYFLLCLVGEIDHHVAAENHGKLTRTAVGLDQVDTAERGQRTDGGRDPVPAGWLALGEEVARHPGGRDSLAALGRVNRAFRPLKRLVG